MTSTPLDQLVLVDHMALVRGNLHANSRIPAPPVLVLIEAGDATPEGS